MPRFRESASAEIATVISDFPTIGNKEIERYLRWKGFTITPQSIATIAGAVRTSQNVNLRGKPRRKHVTLPGKKAIRGFRKKKR